jgi:hypothetical protein
MAFDTATLKMQVRFFLCSCIGGRLTLFDGTHEPGNHRFPPNTVCGRYDGGDLNASLFTSGHVAEVELSGESEAIEDDDVWSFALSFKYVNMGQCHGRI